MRSAYSSRVPPAESDHQRLNTVLTPFFAVFAHLNLGSPPPYDIKVNLHPLCPRQAKKIHILSCPFYLFSYFGGAVPTEPSQSWRGFLAKTRFRREMRSPSESLLCLLSFLMSPEVPRWCSTGTASTTGLRVCCRVTFPEGNTPTHN